MLTPLDIQKKDFSHSFRGYSTEDVDNFLDQVMQDYEALYKENLNQKEQLAQAEQNMSRYRELEDVLKNTMILAQKNADELRQNTEKETQLFLDRARMEAAQINREAEQEALAIIEKAETRSATIIAEAEEKICRLSEEQSRLYKRFQMFRIEFRALLEAQIKYLDEQESKQKETDSRLSSYDIDEINEQAEEEDEGNTIVIAGLDES